MGRFTVTVNDAQEEWVEREASRRDRSKAWVVQQAIDAARGEPSAFTDAVNGGETDAVHDGDTITVNSGELAALQDRVDDLEARLADLERDDGAASDARVTPGGRDDESPTEQRDTESDASDAAAGDGDALPAAADRAIEGLDAPESRREAVRACLSYLQREGQAAKSQFVTDVYPDAPANSGSKEGWWKQTAKHLATVADDVDELEAPRGRGKRHYHWSAN